MTSGRCLNVHEINYRIGFRTRMESNEFREMNVMLLADRSDFQVSGLKKQSESHRSVAQSRRLCNIQWEAN